MAPPSTIGLSSLNGSNGFTLRGTAAGDWSGFSVASAGDVNGDGFADLIVGAPSADPHGSGSGASYVVFGKASGFAANIELSSLNGGTGFKLSGVAGGDNSGRSVASAGDVNGDGFDDLIVGAPTADPNGLSSGASYVVFGKASGFAPNLDLSSLDGSTGFKLSGGAAYDVSGWSVASAGDVNGDGYSDLIVGATLADANGNDSGASYVVFGKASGFAATLELSALDGTTGFRLSGVAAGESSGYSVASAGDVNGDGFADLIVGTPESDPIGSIYDSNPGASYVVFGKASGFGTNLDLSTLDGTTGFKLSAAAAAWYSGISVASAGDVNGDGFADLIIGAWGANPHGNFSGASYVVFGHASGFAAELDLFTLDGSTGFKLSGVAANNRSGWSVSSAGDVNGDGFADLIVGAWGNSAGASYVVFGKASGFTANIDLSSLDGSTGFRLDGVGLGDKTGQSVAAAGDVNGDGFDDLIVGAPYADPASRSNAGASYVVFGGAFGPADAPVTTTGTTSAEILIGGNGDDVLTGGGGQDVFHAGAGDDRLIVSDLTFRLADGGTGTDTLALSGAGLSLDVTRATTAAKLQGIERIDLTGTGDNTLVVDQLAVLGGIGATTGGTHVLTVEGNAGDRVSLKDGGWRRTGSFTDASGTFDRYVLGNAEVDVARDVSVARPGAVELSTFDSSMGFELRGGAAGDHSGWSVASAGDINGDGYADLIVGAPGAGGNSGASYVVFGKASDFDAGIDLSSLDGTTGFRLGGVTAGDQSGWSVSSAGDLNGDGFADLIVGAPGVDSRLGATGAGYVVFGKASGFGATVDLSGAARLIGISGLGSFGWSVAAAGDVNGDGYGDLLLGSPGTTHLVLSSASGFAGSVDLHYYNVSGSALYTPSEEKAGYSVASAGDVNGDGLDDVIVGAPYASPHGASSGASYVVFGHTGGYANFFGLDTLDGRSGFKLSGVGAGDQSGWSVAGAGDFNGDGYADLIVGAGGSSGASYVVFGKASGFGANLDLSTLDGSNGFKLSGTATNDRSGRSVASAGDFNGDGYADLIVGASGADGAAGASYVMFGRASGFAATIALSSLDSSTGFLVEGATANDQSGRSVASAGDVNGDGFDDLIVGAPYADPLGRTDAGTSYVVFGGAFGAADAPVTTTGTTAAEILIGGNADDVLTGGGGRDVFHAGAGDDRLSVADVDFRLADGGTGSDTLVLDGAGLKLDVAIATAAKLQGIERIDLTGTGDNTLVVDKLAVLGGNGAVAGGKHVLTVEGNAGDQVSLKDGGWKKTGSFTDSHGTFDRYVLDNAEVDVEQGVGIAQADVIGLAYLDGTDGFSLRGAAAGDHSGWSVAAAGDINGDGFADVIVGAPGAGGNSGASYVVFGKASGFDAGIDLSSLDGTTGFRLGGVIAGGKSGWSASSAGDVNGDGFADLIVGAPYADNYGSGVGYLVFGKASGFAANVDVSNGAKLQGLRGSSDGHGSLNGWSVAPAGDVNGDGYADLLLGGLGNSYLLLGRAAGFSGNVYPNYLDAPGTQLYETSGEKAGLSIASAGDVNGDGLDDVIVGAPYADPAGRGDAGASYVVFGHTGGAEPFLDLSSLNGGNGFKLSGEGAGNQSGWSVASAGDFNGDGYSDLIVGSLMSDANYVVFGKASGFGANLDLSTLDGTNGFKVKVTLGNGPPGLAGDVKFGRSVASAGDFNGDGYDDLIVGTFSAGNMFGASYVMFGRASGFSATFDLSSLDSSTGFRLDGAPADDRSGRSVASAGDVNGDGFDDLIVGAPYADPAGRGDAGTSYVVFGSAFGSADAPMTTTGTTAAEILIGGNADDVLTGGGGQDVFHAGAGDDRLTVSDLDFRLADGGNGSDTLALDGAGLLLDIGNVSTAGRLEGIERIDLTGTGDNTLVVDRLAVLGGIGAVTGGKHVLAVEGDAGDTVYLQGRGWTKTGSFTDAAGTFDRYVWDNAEVDVEQGVRVAAPIAIALSSLDGSTGFSLRGAAASDKSGWSVASAGDVNGDGFADLIVGAPYASAHGAASGVSYVVFGKASGFGAAIDLSSLDGNNGFKLSGAAATDKSGRSVASAGDVNGDGFDDLIVGARGADGAPGASYVVFGKASGFAANVDLSALDGSSGFRLSGAAGENSGTSVASAGDINGDGFADLIVGAPVADSNAGASYVVFGKASGFAANVDLSALDGTAGFRLRGVTAYDGAGWSVASAGDVNDDGFDDLMVGAWATGYRSGTTYVVFGKASGFAASLDLATLDGHTGFKLSAGGQNTQSGWSVASAGDVNGDGFDDVIVGAPSVAPYAYLPSASYVVFGKASGFAANLDLDALDGHTGFKLTGARDAAGFSVASAGDVNGDGFDDLIVGAKYADANGYRSGVSYVVFGKATGFAATLDLSTLDARTGLSLGGIASGDQSGAAVAAAGDVNGDGFDDLIVGASSADPAGRFDAGESYVVFGGAFGSLDAPVTTVGTTAAEILIGGNGDDGLTGGGGQDVFHAGAGDDRLIVADLDFRRADGGNGTDTLVLDGAGLTLDVTSVAQAVKIEGIERIDLTGGGDNTLAVDRLAVLGGIGAVTGGRHVLTVEGDAGDLVSLHDGGWQKTGSFTDASGTFDRYALGSAELDVEQGVRVVHATLALSSLDGSNGFTLRGGATGDRTGWSAASAGDVNGDGFADLIVGAFGAASNAGASYVVFGKASGLGAAVDLSSLDGSSGFRLAGEASGDQSGFSVASAGDINGDGFADLIVGARFANPHGSDSGASYVVFGKASGFAANIDLSTLDGSVGFKLSGGATRDESGWSVASAGDVNGDGFDDLIVGAPGVGSAPGASYVVFGKASGFAANIELSSLDGSTGFSLSGVLSGDAAGKAVASAGDVNGDGYADLIVGANFQGSSSGASYVVFGKPSSFGANVGLSTLDGTTGFRLKGANLNDQSGFSVASAGDVNGDGFGDLIVGALNVSGSSGASYVVFGKASGFAATLDLSTLDGATGFRLSGVAALDQSGISVASAGDVNGDGYADLIVGAWRASTDGGNSGASYVVFGKASGFAADIDLSSLDGSIGFRLDGVANGDKTGRSVASAGDVNGDGFDDLIVGAPYADPAGRTDVGAGYVVFGGAFGPGDAPVTTTGTTAAEILIGGNGDDVLTGGGGRDVFHAGAGDDRLSVADLGFRLADGGNGTDTLALDGAGLTLDLSVVATAVKLEGIERIDLTGTGDNTLTVDALAVLGGIGATVVGKHVLTVEGDAGDEVFLRGVDWAMTGSFTDASGTFDRYVLGNAEVDVEQGVKVVRPNIALSSLDGSNGFTLRGEAAGDRSGGSVASAGDVNGDGFADLIVGAPGADPHGTYSGASYVVFGKASGFDAGLDLSALDGSNGFKLNGEVAYDSSGLSVASAGDINGDGFDDLIVGAPYDAGSSYYSGASYVVFGRASGFAASLDLSTLDGSNGFKLNGEATEDRSGFSVASAGDVNGDGFDDLIVGARTANGYSGASYVVFGKASGFAASLDLSTLVGTTGFKLNGPGFDSEAGHSVASAGDINGDGFADLIVGVPGNGSGAAYVVFGKAAGFAAGLDLSALDGTTGFALIGVATYDSTGFSVASAGDVNGDGFADLIVGGPGANASSGTSYVVFGKASGFDATVDLSTLDGTTGFRLNGVAASDDSGWAVASAGDINGDGYDDLIVGAPFADVNGGNSGASYVVFGKASGFAADIDLSSLDGSTGFRLDGVAAGDVSGASVAAAGDVNGDGYDDLIVGASEAGASGESYVVFGGAFGSSDAPVTTVGTTSSEILIGGNDDDVLTGGGGQDVFHAGAGDDRLSVADLGFRLADGGNGNDTLALDGAGLSLDVTVVAQAVKLEGIERIDLTGTGDNTLIIDPFAVLGGIGETTGGKHVLAVEGDAGDLVSLRDIGWKKTTSFTDASGTFDRYVRGNAEVDVEQGVKVVRQGVIVLSSLDGSNGFSLNGDATNDYSGRSVASAGDINGDGFADLIVGADQADGFAGASYVVFGKASGFGTGIDLSSLDGSTGFRLGGGGHSGWSVASAGDLNGDGFADLVVGALFASANGYASGASYVVFGTASGFGATLDLSALDGSNGFTLPGVAAGDVSGDSVASAGDVNGDGFDDLIVGAGYADPNGERSGASYVVFGRASGFGGTVDLSALDGSDGFRLAGEAAGDASGNSVASAGDVNGDGFADLIVGAVFAGPHGHYSGASYVVFGKASGFGATLDLSTLDGTTGFKLSGAGTYSYAGISVASAGDVNGDGYADLIVGARGDDTHPGASYVVFGKASAFAANIDLSTLDGTAGFKLSAAATNDLSGASVASAGDINGDGYDDLIVGAPGDNLNTGATYVVFGKASGFGTGIDLSSLDGSSGFRLEGAATFDESGSSVAAAGDVNGDGFDDLIVGAHSATPTGGQTYAGVSYVVFGGAFGASDAPVTTVGTTAAEILIGGNGDDVLTGGGGQDVFHAGAGDDRLVVADLDFRLADGGNGSDTLALGGAGLTLDVTLVAQAVKLEGIERIDLTGSGNNTLIVDQLAVLGGIGAITSGKHVLTVVADSGDVVSFGNEAWVNAGSFTNADGTFDRWVLGNAEVDVARETFVAAAIIEGTSGNDTITASSTVPGQPFPTGGNDIVNGRGGNDIIDGLAGTDVMVGGTGDDTYYVDDAGDRVIEATGEGSDTVYTSVGYTLATGEEIERLRANAGATGLTLIGNEIANLLYGDAGSDKLYGRAGNDHLNGGRGADTMAGGVGNDIYYVDNAADRVIEAVGEGSDKVYTKVDYTLAAGQEIERLRANAGTKGLKLTGNELRNTLEGGAGDDRLYGGRGGDKLYGHEGNDRLDGGVWSDVMAGGVGDDTYYVDTAGDQVIEAAGEGNDKVYAKVDYTLAAGQEIEWLGADAGTTGLKLTGNELANTLQGGGGDDTLTGGAGDDTYFVDRAGDRVIEATGGGNDKVYTKVDYTLAASQEIEWLGADAGTTGLKLTGNELANTLQGGAGDDTLTGGAGDDTYYVDTAGDKVLEAVGEGSDKVYTKVDYTLAASQEIEWLGADAGTTGLKLTGNELANTLQGGGGDDTLTGGAGDDTYLVDNAGDQVIEAAGEGNDTVYASIDYSLAAGQEIERLRANAGATGLKLTGNELRNTLDGGTGDDTLDGGTGDDKLYGRAGNDRLNGGRGADTMAGGVGNDIYYVDNATDRVIEAVGEGSDKVYTKVDYTLAAGQEIEWLRANAGTTGLTLTGNELRNTLEGGAGDDVLNGGRGGDKLYGHEGNDRLDGGIWSDVMAGGVGDDTYAVDNAGDQVIEAAGEGNDKVYAKVDYTLAAGQEIEWLGADAGTTGLKLTGNELANALQGGTGNDTLNGGTGNDTLEGGAGADIFVFDTSFVGTTNVDTIADFDVAQDVIHLDHEHFAGLALSFGHLSASAFAVDSPTGTAPQIIYDSTTGTLSYDGNGADPGGASAFATLTGSPTLAAQNFIVV